MSRKHKKTRQPAEKERESTPAFSGEKPTENKFAHTQFYYHGKGLLVACILFFTVGFLIYSNTFDSPFVFDDRPNILENSFIRLTEISWGQIVDGAVGYTKNRPVSMLSFAINYYFGRYNPFGYHLINIIIHVLNSILLFLFISTTLELSLKKRNNKPYTPPLVFLSISLFAAFLWLVHPLHTQSVTYIVQRMNSMAGLFFIVSMLLYVQGRIAQIRISESKNSPKSENLNKKYTLIHNLWFIGSLISGFLAVGSKESAAILPFFIFLYEWYFFQNLSSDWLKRNLKYVLGVILLIVLIALIFLDFNPFETFLGLRDFAHNEFTISERVLTQFRVVIYYIGLLFYPKPSRLNLDYDFPLSHSLINPVTTLLSLIAIVGLVGLAFLLAKKDRLISFCIIWFLGNLIIESSIIPLAIIFEHRLYLPSMLVCLIPVVIAYRYIIFSWLRISLLCSILALFSFWTYDRNRAWENEYTLWADCVKKSPNKARPHNNFGKALGDLGIIDEAMDHYLKALQIRPDFAKAHFNLGKALAMQGEKNEAFYHFSEALRIKPHFPKAHNNIGILLDDQGKTTEAIQHYNKALQLKPDYAGAHNNLGVALADQGNTTEAIQHYNKALQINSDLVEAHNNLGILLAKLDRNTDAVNHYKEALQIKPDYAEAHLNLGVAQAEQGNNDDAVDHYFAAIQIDPDYMKAHFNLANVLAKQGKTEEAIRHFLEVLRINPDYADAHYNLGFFLANQGKTEEAIHHFVEVLKIDPDDVKTHNNLGAALMMQGKNNEAIGHFRVALRIDPELADAHINLGVSMINIGKIEEAVGHFREALRIKPDATEAQINLNKAQVLLGKIDKSIVRTQKALKRNPNDSELHYQLGTLYQNKGKVEDAVDQFKKAISIQPEFAEALNDLAVMFSIKGEYEKALPLFKRTVGLRPNDLGTYYNISRLYAIQNNSKESVNWLRKAVEKGYADWQRIKTDESFKNIRGSSEYKTLMERH